MHFSSLSSTFHAIQALSPNPLKLMKVTTLGLWTMMVRIAILWQFKPYRRGFFYQIARWKMIFILQYRVYSPKNSTAALYSTVVDSLHCKGIAMRIENGDNGKRS
jgi:hypothetical protein